MSLCNARHRLPRLSTLSARTTSPSIGIQKTRERAKNKMTLTIDDGRNFVRGDRVNESGNRLASGILEVRATSFALRRNGSGAMLMDRMAPAYQGARQDGSDRGQKHRSLGSSRANSGLPPASKAKTEAKDAVSPMAKVIQGIKEFFGIKSRESCFDQFHAAADRVAAKSELLLSERNNFAHGVSRIKARKKKVKSK